MGHKSNLLCKQVEDLITKELALARELIAAKRRERALLALKKKKLREGQLEQIDAYLLNVEQASAMQAMQTLFQYPCNPSHHTASASSGNGSPYMCTGMVARGKTSHVSMAGRHE